MNLSKKKILAAKTLRVGKKRIIFVTSRIEEIKEAITKQDIRDLHKEGAILLRKVGGRKTVVKRKGRKSTGNIRKKIRNRKRTYITLTRKLRRFLAEWSRDKKIAPEELKDIRKKIKNRQFKNKWAFKEYLGGLRK